MPGALILVLMLWGIYKIIHLVWRGIKALFTKRLKVPRYRVYSSAYVKKLELFMDLSRKAILIYQKSKHDPNIAVFALENMKSTMNTISNHLDMSTELEHREASESLQAMRRELSRVRMYKR